MTYLDVDTARDFVATDLHGHTFFSDGRTSPEDYVQFRKKRNFDVIALSDHDTFAGVSRAFLEAKRAAAGSFASQNAKAGAGGEAPPSRPRANLTLVPAMEATSFIHFGSGRAEQVHILAYFPPSFLDDNASNSSRLWKTKLHARSLELYAKWRNYALDFVARQPQHVRDALDETQLRAMTSSEFPQLQSLILRIAERSPETFAHFQLDHVHFWDDAALFAWSPEELIETIRSDGGLDVIAHPNRYRDKERVARVYDVVSGIEVYTSRHHPDVAARFRALAESKQKHWTASSDDHQHRVYIHPPSGTPRRTVERILAGA